MVLRLSCGILAVALIATMAASRSASQDAPVTPPPKASTATSPASKIEFSGEVFRGQIYEHELSRDLVFRLTPAVSDEGGGWVIGILPDAAPADEPIEFVEIATPPYHGYNERYLAATNGYSAREVVKITTRTFYFVHSVADQHIASEVVNSALYPSTVSEMDRSRIASEAANVLLGRGQLRITHYHINPAKNGEPDTIGSVRFDVTLDFSPNLTLQDVLAPKPAKLGR
jgi:hypothetical protein